MRGSRALWAAVAAALVLAVGIGGWLWSSAHAASEVRVSWSSLSPACTGTTVHRKPMGPVIKAVRGMRCEITVVVANRSRFDVGLRGATVPYAGRQTGAVVSAGNADRSTDFGLDAAYDLDRTVPSGHSDRFVIVVRFHPSGCNDGGTLTIDGWPVVHLGALGLSHDRPASATFAFSRDGRTPGCAEG